MPPRPQPPAPGDVSIVICTYTDARLEQLREALRSVTGGGAEVILVVDHNPALQARLATEAPAVRVISNREQRGLSGARNSGVAASGAELVAFLDDDATVAQDWLARLTAPFADPAVAVVGGATDPWWESERPAWFPDEFGWVLGYSYRGLPTSLAPVRNPFGGNMAVRRELLLRAGGFRSGIGRIGTKPLGGEETDLCIRIARTTPGALVLYEPAARMRHWVPDARARPGYFASRCFAEGFSKALLAAHNGADAALETERDYVRTVLPRALARELRQALGARDRSAAARAGAIVTGVGLAAAGYLRARLPGGVRPGS